MLSVGLLILVSSRDRLLNYISHPLNHSQFPASNSRIHLIISIISSLNHQRYNRLISSKYLMATMIGIRDRRCQISIFEGQTGSHDGNNESHKGENASWGRLPNVGVWYRRSNLTRSHQGCQRGSSHPHC